MAQTGAGSGNTSQPDVTRLQDGSSTNLAAVSAGGALSVALSGGTDKDNADAIATIATGLTRVPSEGFVFNGTTWDRARSISAVGDGLGVTAMNQPGNTYGSANATNALATVTFAAVAGQSHRITSATAAYQTTPVAAAAMTLNDNAVTKFAALASATPAGPALPAGGAIASAPNQAVTWSIAAGGAGVVGWAFATKLTA
jgi:hypothetical protein